MVESEYSPISLLMPPRFIGMLHSLTLCTPTSFGNSETISGIHASFQPQSQTINSALVPARKIPSWIAAFASAITSAGLRFPQRGHSAPRPWDQQLLRFSEPEIV